MSQTRLPLLVNASSPRARAILEAVRTFGAAVDATEVSATDIVHRFRELASSGVKRVGVAGGDGTVAAAAEAASSLSLELAVIPGGTLNHLAKDLEIPDDLEEALRLALGGIARPVDAGTVNGRLFLNTSSAGTYVTFVRMRERLERWLGYRVASVAAALRLLARPRVFTVEVEIEGTMQRYVTPLVFVGVGERELKLPTLGGRASPGRRGLHLLIVRGRSRARLAALAFSAAARGTRSATRGPALDAFVVDHLTIRVRRAHVYVATDGEVHAMSAPLEYRWLPDSVKVVVPR